MHFMDILSAPSSSRGKSYKTMFKTVYVLVIVAFVGKKKKTKTELHKMISDMD